MRGKGLSLFLAAALSGAPEVTRGQATSDPEIAKGVRQVEEGEYETAIFTLDAATRRLAGKPANSRDLGQAYLYLGIAYLARGHETLAKAKFQEALAQTKDLTVNLDKFPPKVLELIEEARRESAVASPKKGGSKTALILLGVGGAAAAGIAVAASGGGSGQSIPPESARRTETFAGFLALDQENPDFAIAVTGSGLLEAELTWPEPGALLHIFLLNAVPRTMLSNTGANTSSSPHRLSYNITPGNYRIGVSQRIARNGFQPPLSTSGGTFTLRVTHP